MHNKPGAIWHMMAWGVTSGFILAYAYMIILFDVLNNINSFAFFINPFFWLLSFIFGAIPGAIMGFFVGLNLRGLLITVPMPFTKADMNAKRLEVYGWTFALTLFLSFLLIF